MPVRRPTLEIFWNTSSEASLQYTLYPNFENQTISQVIDKSPHTMHGVFLLDESARMILADPSMIITFNPTLIPGFGCPNLVAPDSYMLCGVFKANLNHGRSLFGVSLNYLLNGHPVRVWLNLSPIFDSNNKPVALKSGVLLDSKLRHAPNLSP